MVSIKKKIKKVFKKDSSKKTEAAADVSPGPAAPTASTYDALMEARENDEANVCMPKDDIRDEEKMVIVEDVTDMEEYLSVVEEVTTKEEMDLGEDEPTQTPAEMKVVDEAPVAARSFMCGITNCLGGD
mmetsp:Transcript_22184/g.31702  ORF Transcript_22184/g.31702 Transcript_22184/m.31702 type:complete len:129 (-) Transcript_22184:118-504(-)|eukprot:CAMPEP_0201688256 /NCGR_PEP_ID=MMETSP0578-20130828/1998_1 /ASSEMBLY_ACC=CAM_ASM_000663 /TAXON_ID=267565 /ORGANISM="Skeletonema grethea, Strain CCMP 1804" /LENGTH=128 /DNA_ID=CAMNT_0048172493 /DNA_START=62 /DNA_END=448 /DNA_ORIENTATION=+